MPTDDLVMQAESFEDRNPEPRNLMGNNLATEPPLAH